jgi:hypothetical protein
MNSPIPGSLFLARERFERERVARRGKGHLILSSAEDYLDSAPGPPRHMSPRPSPPPGISPNAGASSDSIASGPLLLGAPGQVLEVLLRGDPLGLRARIVSRLEARAWLCDVDRLVTRVAASCALEARHWSGTPSLAAWLDGLIDRAAADLGAETCAPPGAWSLFAEPLGLDGERLRRACGRFAGLSFEAREAFFRLVLDGASLNAFARERGLTLTEAARRARAGLEVLRSALDPGAEDGQ